VKFHYPIISDSQRSFFCLERKPNTHEGERLMKETLKIMNLTYFNPKIRENMENKSNSLVNIRFVAKTSNIGNFSVNMRCDVETSEVATLISTRQQRWDRIWITGVDSGRILRFSFGLGSGPGVKNL